VKNVKQNAGLRFLFDIGWNFGRLKTLIGENVSSCSIDPCPLRCWLHIVRTSANINKVKDLTVTLMKVSFAHEDFIVCQETSYGSALFHTLYSQPCKEMVIFSGKSHCCNSTFTNV